MKSKSQGNRHFTWILIGSLVLWTPTTLWALDEAPAAAPAPAPEPAPEPEPEPDPERAVSPPPPADLAPPLPKPTQAHAPDVEPPPEMPGPALLITGWSMFGAGAIYSAVFGLLWANSDTCLGLTVNCRTQERSPTLLAYTAVFGVVAFTGLALALIGHQRRAEARELIELWESEHGKRPDLGQRLRLNGQWSPLALSDGGLGLGWSSRF